jgi:hypothetical protein
MTGETDLATLILTMRPALHDDVFVFVTLDPWREWPAGIAPVMIFQEGEGPTLIVREDEALSAGLGGVFRCRWITMNVHSSLEAVGFLAAITRALADRGISMNAVSAFYHDHLFVGADRAHEAMRILEEMARPAKASG